VASPSPHLVISLVTIVFILVNAITPACCLVVRLAFRGRIT
jgi:hypothetical protein